MIQLVRKAILWTLCGVFSVLSVFKLLKLYITKFSSQPWKPKDHSNAPANLTDPKYGVSKFAQVNVLRLHYVEAGDTSKPLMLLVHGFPEFWYSFRNQIPEFSKDFWVVALDMRGYNLSERPDGVNNYLINDIVEDLRALIEHLNRKKCILVCHDWGSIIGWEFLSKYKFMVEKYVMMGAPSRRVFSQLFRNSMDQFKRSWYMVFFQMPALPELMLSADDFASFAEFFPKEDVEAYKHAYARPGALTATINYYRANFGGLGPRPEDTLTLDGSDGMFVLGEEEKYISLDSLALTAKTYPKIRVETIPNAGHFLHLDAPKATNDLLRNFLGPASAFSVESLK